MNKEELLTLREIRALGDSRYEVEFDDGQRVVCRVFKKGVFGVAMDPTSSWGASRRGSTAG